MVLTGKGQCWTIPMRTQPRFAGTTLESACAMVITNAFCDNHQLLPGYYHSLGFLSMGSHSWASISLNDRGWQNTCETAPLEPPMGSAFESHLFGSSDSEFEVRLTFQTQTFMPHLRRIYDNSLSLTIGIHRYTMAGPCACRAACRCW